MIHPAILSITPHQNGTLVRSERAKCFGGGVIERVFNVSQPMLSFGIRQWLDGILIQDALPYLTLSEREFFLTGLSDQEYFDNCGPED